MTKDYGNDSIAMLEGAALELERTLRTSLEVEV